MSENTNVTETPIETPVTTTAPAVKKVRRPKRKHSTEFKIQVLDAINGGQKPATVAKQYELSLGLIDIWRKHREAGKYNPKI